ncbi:Putative peptidoglycan binding domain-containing protein [Azotobacter beijerinckii]|uniref:Putative peptidoglycan binding domain-containing protein n=1 Tax=Azotobacter beijerinckii TaxID=170623 RepID=A0A1H9RLU5_9GAMM|nr:peptidoglycan-binding protein [Azotobacter beijerinckii]SER73023.1 Putative peptidoglycan binding domain-containing protein [Azotobacter beijerinckii]
MDYPRRIVKVGEQDVVIVKALKEKLNISLGIGNDPDLHLDLMDGNFGPKMKQAVKLFQARNVDGEGRPLKQDGEVGSLTWEALFGKGTVATSANPGDPLLQQVLKTAGGEAARRVLEVPRNSNRGPQVDTYLRCVGAPLGVAWCCAFVYYCFEEAAGTIGRTNPMVKTAGCLDHWRRAPSRGGRRMASSQAVNDPSLVKAGMIFIMDHGGGLGHTGLVEHVVGGLITTIEGNTDASKTREGGGVYRLTRKFAEINKGFIDYAGV